MSRVAKSENQAEIWPKGLTGNSLSVLFLPIQVTSLGSTGTAKYPTIHSSPQLPRILLQSGASVRNITEQDCFLPSKL